MGLLNDFSPNGVTIDLTSTDYAPASAFGIYVGTAGNVKLDTLEGSTLTVPVQAGAVLPWAASRIYKTGTTATGLFTVKLP